MKQTTLILTIIFISFIQFGCANNSLTPEQEALKKLYNSALKVQGKVTKNTSGEIQMQINPSTLPENYSTLNQRSRGVLATFVVNRLMKPTTSRQSSRGAISHDFEVGSSGYWACVYSWDCFANHPHEKHWMRIYGIPPVTEEVTFGNQDTYDSSNDYTYSESYTDNYDYSNDYNYTQGYNNSYQPDSNYSYSSNYQTHSYDSLSGFYGNYFNSYSNSSLTMLIQLLMMSRGWN